MHAQGEQLYASADVDAGTPEDHGGDGGGVVGAIALTGIAFAYDGLPTAKVELNDVGVWLTKTLSRAPIW